MRPSLPRFSYIHIRNKCSFIISYPVFSTYVLSAYFAFVLKKEIKTAENNFLFARESHTSIKLKRHDFIPIRYFFNLLFWYIKIIMY